MIDDVTSDPIERRIRWFTCYVYCVLHFCCGRFTCTVYVDYLNHEYHNAYSLHYCTVIFTAKSINGINDPTSNATTNQTQTTVKPSKIFQQMSNNDVVNTRGDGMDVASWAVILVLVVSPFLVIGCIVCMIICCDCNHYGEMVLPKKAPWFRKRLIKLSLVTKVR